MNIEKYLCVRVELNRIASDRSSFVSHALIG